MDKWQPETRPLFRFTWIDNQKNKVRRIGGMLIKISSEEIKILGIPIKRRKK